MVKFNVDKLKKLSFEVTMDSVDSVVPHFVIESKDIKYLFKGNYNNGRIEFEIPPLVQFIPKNNINETYNCYMEVIANNKYYLKPFADTMIVNKEPNASVKLTEQIDEESIVPPNVNVVLSEDIEKEISKQKTSNFTKFVTS
jgi:hypothetical protein